MKKQATRTLTFPQITGMADNRPEERRTETLGRRGETKPKRSDVITLPAPYLHPTVVTKSNDRETAFCREFFNTHFLFKCYL